MNSKIRLVKDYIAPNGKNVFGEWLDSLTDMKAQLIVDKRITKLRQGVMGDCEYVGRGVSELKIHYGPGYRIYFGQMGKTVVLLLCGGIKKTQREDISKAWECLDEYKRRV